MNDPASLIRSAPFASMLVLAIVVPSLMALTRWPGLIERGVFRPNQFLPQRQWSTVLTSAFLHADGMHLAVNLFSLWAFAFQLEPRMGSGRFALLYLLGILAGNAGTWLAHRRHSGYQTLGASGALLAVLFASVLYFPTSQLVVFPFPMPLPAPVFALAYLAYTWQSARRGGGRVNHDAHFGGALAGVAFVALSDPRVITGAVRAWMS